MERMSLYAQAQCMTQNDLVKVSSTYIIRELPLEY